MAKFVNISGKVYVDTVDYGMLSVSDYNDVSKFAAIPKKSAPARCIADLAPLQNDAPDLTKEEIVSIATSHITKHVDDISHDISFGSKYHGDRAFIIQGLTDAFPDCKWYVKGKNSSIFVCRGDKVTSDS